MKIVCALVLTLALFLPAQAAEPVTQTFGAPMDRVWTAMHSVLTQMDWDVDKEDRSMGWITTKSRRVDGEDFGVYAKGTRHRLVINMKAAGENRTSVSVDRAVFKRERILWIDKDEPTTVSEHEVEKMLLTALGKTL
jgi:uncharacterized lipoprotein